ncbi:hypothetical protein V1L52_05805 [Treponema sp. HNW]|uniref:hypothetical protein n=1 Tax=Treponema sp. HNW TaxID=3116654 RepID=UPI003D0C34E0
MKEKTFIIGAALCSAFFCFILIFCRTAPSFKIWQNYTVFYTERGVSEDTVLDLFSREGVAGVLSLRHTRFPPLPALTPVQYMNGFAKFSYEDLQNLFFSDKNGNYRLYYVPQEAAGTAVSALKNADFKWGTDARGKRPYTVPAAVFLLFICFTLFAKNKGFFSAVFFPFVLYTFSVPFYHSASFVCPFGFALFIIQKSWRRKNFFKKALMHPLVVSSAFLLSLSAAVSGVRPLLLFCAAVCASAASVYVLFKLEGFRCAKAVFNPVFIIPAALIDTRDILRVRFALIPALCIALFTVSFFISGFYGASGGKTGRTAGVSGGLSGGISDAYFPAPIKKTVKKDFSLFSYNAVNAVDIENRLPDLIDFIGAFWFTETYPFRKLDSLKGGNPSIGDRVTYSDYKREGGRLNEVSVNVAVFDEAYIRRITELAYRNAFLGSGGAEALLSRQKGFMRTGYVRVHGAQNGTAALIFTLCAFIYILVLLIGLSKYRFLFSNRGADR